MSNTSIVDEERKRTAIDAITEVHGPVGVIDCDDLLARRQTRSTSLNHETVW